MHIAPFDNQNRAIVDVDNALVPLVYFNIIRLKAGESFDYRVAGYETCIVPATGTVTVETSGETFANIGHRGVDVWGGGQFAQGLRAFAVRAGDIDKVQYGSDDTKTHRKIKHILGAAYHDRVGRLLVSELFTVGAGGWSGFPSHKHDTDRLPDETRHDECYNFRFRPDYGSGLQMLQRVDNEPGDAYHIVNRSTVLIDKGYHPCCVLPGYEMYYFTILGGQSQRSLKQHFQPSHAAQLHTIPGIMDMVAKFK